MEADYRSYQFFILNRACLCVRTRVFVCPKVGLRWRGMPLKDVPGLQIFNAEWLPLQLLRAYRIRQKVVAVGLRRGEAQR